MALYPSLTSAKHCQRCQLKYPASYAKCCYCAGLSDEHLALLQKQHKAQLNDISRTGLLFTVILLLLLGSLFWLA